MNYVGLQASRLVDTEEVNPTVWKSSHSKYALNHVWQDVHLAVFECLMKMMKANFKLCPGRGAASTSWSQSISDYYGWSTKLLIFANTSISRYCCPDADVARLLFHELADGLTDLQNRHLHLASGQVGEVHPNAVTVFSCRRENIAARHLYVLGFQQAVEGIGVELFR